MIIMLCWVQHSVFESIIYFSLQIWRAEIFIITFFVAAIIQRGWQSMCWWVFVIFVYILCKISSENKGSYLFYGIQMLDHFT